MKLSFSTKLHLALLPLVLMGGGVAWITKQSLLSNPLELSGAWRVKEFAIRSQALLPMQDDASKALLIDMTDPAASMQKIKAYDAMKAAFAEITQLSPRSEISQLIAELRQADEKEIGPIDTRVLEANASEKTELARKIYNEEYKPARARFEAIITRLVDEAEHGTVLATESVAEKNRHAVVTICAALFGGLVLAIGTMLFVTRRAMIPLRQTAHFARALAEGDLTGQIEVQQRDEIGQLAAAMNGMGENLREMLGRVSTSSSELTAASQQLVSTGEQCTSNAATTSTQAQAVTSAAEFTRASVAEMAEAAEEMSGSIRDVSKQSNEATQIAFRATDVAHRTGETFSRLDGASKEIGDVVKVITSIAEQTNLLALNATIEAARAGETGKGFAVVANEVKELARRTASATEEIGDRIGAIQSNTQVAVAALKEISEIIGQFSAIQDRVGAAVERQTVATERISRGANDASRNTDEIVHHIASVSEAATSTIDVATTSATAARGLTTMAEELRALVSQFKLSESVEGPLPTAREKTRSSSEGGVRRGSASTKSEGGAPEARVRGKYVLDRGVMAVH